MKMKLACLAILAFAAIQTVAQQIDRPILFSSTREGNSEIYRMNADGSVQTRLTNAPENDNSAKWSPDGSKIIWTKAIGSLRQVWLMDADGANQALISGTQNVQLHYGWSPDESRILYGVRVDGGTVQLWTMNTNGSDKVQLTNPPAGIEDHTAAWSPDGQKVAFGRCNPASFVCDVWTINTDGTGETNLTPNNAGDDDGASFTPDGRILFGRSNVDALTTFNTYVMNADGSGQTPLTSVPDGTGLFGVQLSPDGTTALATQSPGTIAGFEMVKISLIAGGVVNITNNSVTDTNGFWSPQGDRIVFLSRRDASTGEIYVMNADGTNVVRLTNNASTDTVTDWYRPRLEPDNRLLFVSFRTGDQEIFTTNADGSAIKRLTSSASYDERPIWSPDGTRFLFYSERDHFSGDIYAANADGTNVTRLTSNDALREYGASWSPDGSQVVFGAHGAEAGSSEIYVMNADGSGITQLTVGGGDDFLPHWSPNGNQIAFSSERTEAGNVDVYLMDQDGTAITRITTSPGADTATDWSKDGLRLLIESNRDGDTEIYRIDADGGNPIRLTNHAGHDGSGSFSPDGGKIAFVRAEAGNWDIYTMNADGTGLVRVTFDDAVDALPDWQPVFHLVTVSGRVQAASGTPIAGAKVSVRNEFGNIRKLTTDAAGNFTLGYVAPGASYQIEVKAKKQTFALVNLVPTEDVAGLVISASP